MKILVTGGSGYIGSHTVLELLRDGHQVVAVDNLSNSSQESLKRVEKISGKKVEFYEVDCADKNSLEKVFQYHHIDAVIHFAGYKAVGESVDQPLKYYRNNIDSSLTLSELMQKYKVNRLIFSSSATVYEQDQPVPWSEATPSGGAISNPYGRTKFMIEEILRDLASTSKDWRITILRYFNPVGAHPSGQIGEDPEGVPNNLMPFVAQVAVGKRNKLNVFGGDYGTPDGTCIRDFIHVTDLARGHVAALRTMETYGVYNLGSGQGHSVLEMVHAFEKACGHAIPYEITDRRPGDIACYYANASKAGKDLDWHTKKSIDDMCADTWRWQSQNPSGYGKNEEES